MITATRGSSASIRTSRSASGSGTTSGNPSATTKPAASRRCRSGLNSCAPTSRRAIRRTRRSSCRRATSSSCRSTPSSGAPAGEGETGISEAFISGTQPGTAIPHYLNAGLTQRLSLRLRVAGNALLFVVFAAGCPSVPDAFCIRYALMNGSRSPSRTRLGSPTSNFVR